EDLADRLLEQGRAALPLAYARLHLGIVLGVLEDLVEQAGSVGARAGEAVREAVPGRAFRKSYPLQVARQAEQGRRAGGDVDAGHGDAVGTHTGTAGSRVAAEKKEVDPPRAVPRVLRHDGGDV